jgi:hypothetical protein
MMSRLSLAAMWTLVACTSAGCGMCRQPQTVSRPVYAPTCEPACSSPCGAPMAMASPSMSGGSPVTYGYDGATGSPMYLPGVAQ